TFSDGGAGIGTGTLSAGTATFTTTDLPAGVHAITATYSANTTFAASTSATLSQSVTQAASTTALISSANPSAVGQSVTFTATVTSGVTATPTGTVVFKDGASPIFSGTLNAGTLSFSISTLSLGSHSITAAYQGDANFTASTSSVVTQTVNHPSANTTTTVTSSANPATTGQAITFTAAVTSTSPGTPTGTVTFLDGTSTLGTATLDATAHATFSASSGLSAGSHSITAKYSGDATFITSTSAALSQSVNAPPLDFTISGTGAGTPSATVIAGQSANYSLQLGIAAGATGSLNVTITCTGAPKQATCSGPPPFTLDSSGPATINIGVTTTARSAALPSPSATPQNPVNLLVVSGMTLLAMLLSMALGSGRLKMKQSWAAISVARIPARKLAYLMPSV